MTIQTAINKSREAAIQELRDYLTYLRVQYLSGGKDESTMQAIKDSIDSLERFLKEENL